MITWFGSDIWVGVFTMLTILLMETMLSVDNAAVLAIMVKGLPKDQQPKALEYGIWGAFILRGVCLIFVSFLVSVWWLKVVGGVWLVWLCVKHFWFSSSDDDVAAEEKGFYKWASKYVSVFWATVALVEVMDLAFSMDNIFAVTAMTKLVGWMILGVVIGIVCMRFVAKQFIKLMERFPFLENVAFVIIGMLGLKLVFTLYTHQYPSSKLTEALDGKSADYLTSGITVLIFLIPILTSLLFNIPKGRVPLAPDEFTQEAETGLEEIA